jgi:pimeloyl-ACP methyl ester carboxylesterase
VTRAPGKPIPLAFTDERGRGRPILLVHGFSHNRFVWSDLARRLDPDLRPIAVDLRGHGESPWSPAGHYDVRDYALDLPATLDALDVDRAIVVGHSLGGNAATLFAADVPERVEALVLLDTGPTLSLGAMVHIARDAGEAFRSYGSLEAYRERLERTHPQGDPALIARVAEHGLVRRRDGHWEPAMDPGVVAGSAEDADLEALERELWSALSRIECPTLLVRGGRSAVLAEEIARRMVDEVLARGRLETLEGAGHGIMLDDGAGLRRCLEDFLAGAE